MSITKSTGSKPQECGDMHHIEKMIRDSIGGIVDFQIVGTDTTLSGVKTGVSITALTGDYSPGSGFTGEKNPDGTFLICIEAEGVFYVTLADGSDFIITAVQAGAYLGQWYPAKLYSVNVGTTGDFSVGY
jgi:hypothetical protein